MKNAAIIFTVLCVSLSRVYANHIPSSEKNLKEWEAAQRVFIKKDRITGLIDLRGRWERSPTVFQYRSVMLGPYYKLMRFWRIGAFYRYQQGRIHDNDWVWVKPNWLWRDTRERSEHVLSGDNTFRFQIPFLTSIAMVAELKTRYEWNSFNDHQTLILRPSLAWHFMGELRPKLSFLLQAELWKPVNYGKHTFWETWYYGALLWHVIREYSIGITLAYRNVFWSPSKDFSRLHPNEDYGSGGIDSSWVFGLVSIYRLRL